MDEKSNDDSENVGLENPSAHDLKKSRVDTKRISVFRVIFLILIFVMAWELLGSGGMHSMDEYAYGYWGTVLGLILLSVFFVTRYLPMKTRMEKRSGGILIAFAVALFTEMYGFPLTIFFLSSYLGVDIPLTHDWGHLLGAIITRLGLGNGWFIVMVVSTILIFLGLRIVINGWRQIYWAEGRLVTTGLYSKIRHPQYTGIMLITVGFLIQWLTIITLIMWPFLMLSYYQLAIREEKLAEDKFGKDYREYKRRVPMFLPSVRLTRSDMNIRIQ